MSLYTEVSTNLEEDYQQGFTEGSFTRIKISMPVKEEDEQPQIILDTNLKKGGNVTTYIEKQDLIDLAEAILKHYK